MFSCECLFSSMGDRTLRFQLEVQGDPNVTLSFNDALVAAVSEDGGWIITSPNVGFIPRPIIGLVEVRLREDGRYGEVDPIQWPQLFDERLPHYAMIPRCAKDGQFNMHPAPAMWLNAKDSDFVPCGGGSMVEGLGFLRSVAVEALEKPVDHLSKLVTTVFKQRPSRLAFTEMSMRHACTRLRHCPATRRDIILQVAEVQRYYLETLAYLNWHAEFVDNPLASPDAVPITVADDLMGALTTDPGVVQKLMSAGIPVWYFRRPSQMTQGVVIRRVVGISTPNVKTEHGMYHGVPIYTGSAGYRHLIAMGRGGHTYHDIASTPYPNVQDPALYFGSVVTNKPQILMTPEELAALLLARPRSPMPMSNSARSRPRTHTQPYYIPPVRGRDKFVELEHAYMPPVIEIWAEALTSVNRARPRQSGSRQWGYWTPEPALVLGPTAPMRVARYIRNWVAAREPWLYLLEIPTISLEDIKTQTWRTLLNNEGDLIDAEELSFDELTTRAAKTKAEVVHVFGRVFEKERVNPQVTRQLAWFGHRFDVVPATLAPQIIWELHELGFRYELLALDRHFVPNQKGPAEEILREELISAIFSGNGAIRVTSLPTFDCGLAARKPKDRAASLEALRKVMLRWTPCPPLLRKAQPLSRMSEDDYISMMERYIARGYTQCFYDASGRAPIVPHRFPFMLI
ncbi:hypothetical protein A0H81_09432 [Grifola frondosa]|uniref:Uncharacterized protein n=1 Tax=Grifola frondosa TaxID=5627 RepID=A0A1C7M2V7_GRIFR|nr:hypothetical protein A0H81_09432 [Grifola frondosa]